MDEHEERLRSALRRSAGTPGEPHDPYDPGLPVDTEGMLARVRRGARRRRARRAAGSVIAVAAVVTALTVAVPSVLDGRDTTVADDTPAGPGALVQTVAAAGDGVWATVRVECDGGTCPALARSSDAGETWAVSAVRPVGSSAAFASQQVELAEGGTDGWAWNQSTLVATHDSGSTWAEVVPPGGPLVSAVAAGSYRAVALTQTGPAGRSTLSVSSVATDRWLPTATPLRRHETVTRVFAGGGVLGAVVGSRFAAPQALLVAPQSAGWVRRALPCQSNGEVFADTDGVTMWTACLNGGTTVVADSTDGIDWDTVRLPAIVGRASMAARDDGSVLLAGPDLSYVVGSDGSVDEIDPPAGDPDADEAVDDGYGSAASGTRDFLVTSGGRLLGSVDDGNSWSRVTVD